MSAGYQALPGEGGVFDEIFAGLYRRLCYLIVVNHHPRCRIDSRLLCRVEILFLAGQGIERIHSVHREDSGLLIGSFVTVNGCTAVLTHGDKDIDDIPGGFFGCSPVFFLTGEFVHPDKKAYRDRGGILR